jgi:hypothetical protein
MNNIEELYEDLKDDKELCKMQNAVQKIPVVADSKTERFVEVNLHPGSGSGSRTSVNIPYHSGSCYRNFRTDIPKKFISKITLYLGGSKTDEIDFNLYPFYEVLEDTKTYTLVPFYTSSVVGLPALSYHHVNIIIDLNPGQIYNQESMYVLKYDCYDIENIKDGYYSATCINKMMRGDLTLKWGLSHPIKDIILEVEDQSVENFTLSLTHNSKNYVLSLEPKYVEYNNKIFAKLTLPRYINFSVVEKVEILEKYTALHVLFVNCIYYASGMAGLNYTQ